jgi:hypothetical protein
MKRAPIFDVELRELRLEQNGYLRRRRLDQLGSEILRADTRQRAQAPKPTPKPQAQEPRGASWPISNQSYRSEPARSCAIEGATPK